MQRAGNRVRVNAQLIDARTDTHLWAQTYDRDLADVFAIQSEIAKAIADQLPSEAFAGQKGRLQQKPTESGEAYLIYLRAQDRWVRSQSHEDLEQVAQLSSESDST